MSFGKWCANYNGITSKVCDAGIRYDDVRDKHGIVLSQFPCFKDSKSVIVCDKRRWYTNNEVREQDEAIDRKIKKFNELLQKDICPQCESSIDEKKQIGRCVYAYPCGHRLYHWKWLLEDV